MTVAYAVSRANLVIIPTQGSQLDAAEAAKSHQTHPPTGESLRTTHSLCSSVHADEYRHPTADVRHIQGEFVQHDVPAFSNSDA